MAHCGTRLWVALLSSGLLTSILTVGAAEAQGVYDQRRTHQAADFHRPHRPAQAGTHAITPDVKTATQSSHRSEQQKFSPRETPAVDRRTADPSSSLQEANGPKPTLRGRTSPGPGATLRHGPDEKQREGSQDRLASKQDRNPHTVGAKSAKPISATDDLDILYPVRPAGHTSLINTKTAVAIGLPQTHLLRPGPLSGIHDRLAAVLVRLHENRIAPPGAHFVRPSIVDHPRDVLMPTGAVIPFHTAENPRDAHLVKATPAVGIVPPMPRSALLSSVGYPFKGASPNQRGHVLVNLGGPKTPSTSSAINGTQIHMRPP